MARAALFLILSALVPGAARGDCGLLARINPVKREICNLRSEEVAVRESAARALAEMGPRAADAAPALVDALADESPLVVAQSVRALTRIGKRAITALLAVYEKAADGAPTVDSAMRALVATGPKALGPLTRAAGHKSPRVRARAVQTLGKMGRRAASAARTIVAALSDRDRSVRLAALEAVGEVGPGSLIALPGLRRALWDTDRGVRWRAAQALQRMGHLAVSAIPDLVRVMAEPDPVGVSARQALISLGPHAVKLVADALQHRSATRRRAATEVLGGIGRQAAPAVGALTAVLNDSSPDVRRGAARALGRMGSAAAPAIPALKRTLKDRYILVKQEAALALARIKPPRREVQR